MSATVLSVISSIFSRNRELFNDFTQKSKDDFYSDKRWDCFKEAPLTFKMPVNEIINESSWEECSK